VRMPGSTRLEAAMLTCGYGKRGACECGCVAPMESDPLPGVRSVIMTRPGRGTTAATVCHKPKPRSPARLQTEDKRAPSEQRRSHKMVSRCCLLPYCRVTATASIPSSSGWLVTSCCRLCLESIVLRKPWNLSSSRPILTILPKITSRPVSRPQTFYYYKQILKLRVRSGRRLAAQPTVHQYEGYTADSSKHDHFTCTRGLISARAMAARAGAIGCKSTALKYLDLSLIIVIPGWQGPATHLHFPSG